jgi:aryl-alcohol dehydrogenase-like predicted oxidoreductase
MRYRVLGRTGLLVSEMCLGTNTFGGKGNPLWEPIGGLDVREATAMVARAFEGGINFFDTANIYGGGDSEVVLGQALREADLPREETIILTKGGMRFGAGKNGVGATRAHLSQALEGSLMRLGADYVDVYMVHQFDRLTPMEETLRALDDFVRAGKVRYLGCSNFAAWQVAHALGVSERENLARFEVLEAYYSVAVRDIEREIVPMALDRNVGIMVWGALLGGILTGKYARGGGLPEGTRFSGGIWMPFDEERTFNTLDVLTRIANEHGARPGQIAIAWLLHQKVMTSVAFGARTIAQLESNLAATDITLSAEELDALNKVSALPAEYPEWKLAEAYADRPDPRA